MAARVTKQAFISVSSCLAKRRPFCGFETLKPVGFCVLCALCGNYIQKNIDVSNKNLFLLLGKAEQEEEEKEEDAVFLGFPTVTRG